MKVLVVGGAGYIGGAVTDRLIEEGIPFTVFDNLTYEDHFLKPVDFIFGDVRNMELDETLVDKYSHVIWLAAIVGDAACALTPQLTRDVNRESLHTFSEWYDGRIIFTSTCSVYGEHHETVNEATKVNPLSLYAMTKFGAETYLEKKDALILRLGTAFGISDTYSRPRMDLVVNQMAVAAATKGIITVNGGEQWRPMIHVHDIARAIVWNLNSDRRGIYNLATTNLQIKDLAAKVATITDCKVEYKPMAGDGRDYRVSTVKAARDDIFGSSFQHGIEFGVKQFTDLVRSGRVKDLEHNRYFNVKHLAGQ
jgi:nucleoside-diphosphate-sugar epimerase